MYQSQKRIHQTMTTQLIVYKDHFIHVTSNNEVITTNISSKKWRVSHSVRSAKWNISVWQRLSKEFQE